MTTELIATGLADRNRAASVLTKVQATYPGYTLAEVYTGAVNMGLTHYSGLAERCRVLDGVNYRPLAAADFTPTTPAGFLEVSIEVSADDNARVTTIADEFVVDEEFVRSKALCTGLAFLDGDELYVGPFVGS